jgi:hypothetical protein
VACYRARVGLLIPELPRCSAFELAAAVRRTIDEAPALDGGDGVSGRLPSNDELRDAAEQVDAAAPSRDERGLALLEAPYLVAASDGLEPQERQALSGLIARIVGKATPDAVCNVLDWFDARLAEDGLAARLSHVASHFAGRTERERVLSFAALLALADRRLALAEQNALVALGGALGFSKNEVQMVVHRVAFKLEQAMAASVRIPEPPPLVEEAPRAPLSPSQEAIQPSSHDVAHASTEPAATSTGTVLSVGASAPPVSEDTPRNPTKLSKG